MSAELDKLLAEAARLSLEERARLITELIATLDGDADPDADEAWRTELRRRAELARNGVTQGTDWDVVRTRVENDLRKK